MALAFLVVDLKQATQTARRRNNPVQSPSGSLARFHFMPASPCWLLACSGGRPDRRRRSPHACRRPSASLRTTYLGMRRGRAARIKLSAVIEFALPVIQKKSASDGPKGLCNR